MKAFEKWFRMNHHKKDTDLWQCSTEKAVRQGWRGAIEWAEDQFINKSAFEAEEAINRELREE